MQGPLGSIPRCTNSHVALGADCIKEQFVEKLDLGKSYYILNIGYGSGDELAEFLVPEGLFFFMGDNRDNSVDSRDRSVGTVPFENLVGRAEILFWAWDPRWSWWEVWNWPRAIRFNRIFDLIQ